MDYLHKPNRLLITGRSGTGKTEFLLRYCEAVQDRYNRLCIFDPESQLAVRAKQPILSSVEELEDPPHWACWNCNDVYPGDWLGGFEFYCDYVFTAAQSRNDRSLFVCDEVQKLVSTDEVPFDLSCVIETGRVWEIDTVFVTQQVNLIHNRIRNQQTQICTFRQNDERAIKPLVEFGFDESAIRNLDTGEYICRNDRGEESAGNIFSGSCRVRTDSPDPGGNHEPDEISSESVAPCPDSQ